MSSIMCTDEATAASYAERTIVHSQVPDRKQILVLKKSEIYMALLKKYGRWDETGDKPFPPFKMRADGVITVRKKELDQTEEGTQSSQYIYEMADLVQRNSKRRGDKIIESDGVGIALMLKDMSRYDAIIEPERRALIMSSFTRTRVRKVKHGLPVSYPATPSKPS